MTTRDPLVSLSTLGPDRAERASAGRCVICGGQGSAALDVAGYTIMQCIQCGHQFLPIEASAAHVEHIYGEEYFSSGGDGYAGYLDEERLLTYRGRWYARRLSRYFAPAAVLDVGAAAGFTLRGFQQSGWTCAGVEPNRAMAAFADSRFGLDVATATWEAWESPATFDLVTMLQVIPHFADPRAALHKAHEHLRPGGCVLIETWNRKSWTARLLGRHWHEYSPPSVLHWFTLEGLKGLARDEGLETVAQGRPAKWISAAHAQSLLKAKAVHSRLNRLLYHTARLVPGSVPLPYFAEDLFWILLRRS